MQILNKKKLLQELRAVLNTINKDKEIFLLSEALKNNSITGRQLERSKDAWLDDIKTIQKTKDQLTQLWDKINETLENRLITFGLNNKLDSPLVKFTLKNIHDWKDKTETETKNINVEIYEAIGEAIDNNKPLLEAEPIKAQLDQPRQEIIAQPKAKHKARRTKVSKGGTHTPEWTARRL